MSAGLATSSATIRIASRPSVTPRREVAKPGMSRTTTGSLPSRAASATAASVVSGAVAGPTTTSSSAIAHTGLKKCNPTKPAGRSSPAASSAIGMLDVLLPSSTGRRLSASRRTARLRSSRSGTASTITSAPSATSASPARSVTRARLAVAASSVSLPRRTPRSQSSPSRRRASAPRAGSTSTSSTAYPAPAATYAMPRPMVPAPTTTKRPLIGVPSPRRGRAGSPPPGPSARSFLRATLCRAGPPGCVGAERTG